MQSSTGIKTHIESMVCPVHGIHPIVDDDLDGIKIHCCCNEFYGECSREAESVLTSSGQPDK